MNREEFAATLAEYRERMGQISLQKNTDYAGSEDPFANFRQSEHHAGVSTEQGFLVRMGDKMARIKTFVTKGVLQVKDESVEDTLLDLANYALIMAAYIKGMRNDRDQDRPAQSGTYTVTWASNGKANRKLLSSIWGTLELSSH